VEAAREPVLTMRLIRDERFIGMGEGVVSMPSLRRAERRTHGLTFLLLSASETVKPGQLMYEKVGRKAHGEGVGKSVQRTANVHANKWPGAAGGGPSRMANGGLF